MSNTCAANQLTSSIELCSLYHATLRHLTPIEREFLVDGLQTGNPAMLAIITNSYRNVL
jgi:hypothetical protein